MTLLFSRTAFLASLLLFTSSPGHAQPPQPALTPDAPPTTPAPQAAARSTAASEGMNAAAAVDPSYIIGPDDSLKVDVFNESKYSSALVVRPDGMITISVIGDVMAAGNTPAALAAKIAEALKKGPLVDPTVTVTVNAVNSKRIFFIGEVAHAGPLSLQPGMTILQAISSAGGLTPYANKSKIRIQRGDPPKTIRFDYTKAVKKGDMQGVVLQPGDTVVVP